MKILFASIKGTSSQDVSLHFPLVLPCLTHVPACFSLFLSYSIMGKRKAKRRRAGASDIGSTEHAVAELEKRAQQERAQAKESSSNKRRKVSEPAPAPVHVCPSNTTYTNMFN